MPWTVEDEGAEEEAGGYTEKEAAIDLAALADIGCMRCSKKGRFARKCKLLPPAFSPGGKSKGKGTRSMSTYGGKGGANSPGPQCPGCGKPGHAKEKCWKLHPELAPSRTKKKVQGVEEDEFHS